MNKDRRTATRRAPLLWPLFRAVLPDRVVFRHPQTHGPRRGTTPELSSPARSHQHSSPTPRGGQSHAMSPLRTSHKPSSAAYPTHPGKPPRRRAPPARLEREDKDVRVVEVFLCSVTPTLLNLPNTSPSVVDATSATFSFPLTLLKRPSAVNGSTVLSQSRTAWERQLPSSGVSKLPSRKTTSARPLTGLF